MGFASGGTIVVCSSPNGRGIFKYAVYLSHLKCGRLITCSNRGEWFIAWEIFGVLRYIREMRLAKEIVFANTRVSPLLWLIIDWKKVTVVVHDLMDTNADEMRGSGMKGFKRALAVSVNSWLISSSVRKAERVIFNSRYTRTEVQEWLNRQLKRTAIVFPPPSFSKEVESTGLEYEEREAVKVSPKILVVTGMTKNKRFGDYRRFHEELLEVIGGMGKIVMYGIRLDRADVEFRRWVDESKGWVEVKYRRSAYELYKDYLDCSLVCSLSEKEGYGMPVADAIGFGIPVVARSIDAYKEIKLGMDKQGLLGLGKSIQECVELASDVLVGQYTQTRHTERIELYRQFCAKSEEAARKELEELERED